MFRLSSRTDGIAVRACRLLTRRPHSGKSADIFLDSHSPLHSNRRSIQSSPDSFENKKCDRELEELGGQVIFHWVGAHTGITSNEIADELAKFADTQDGTAPIYNAVPVESAKCYYVSSSSVHSGKKGKGSGGFVEYLCIYGHRGGGVPRAIAMITLTRI